MPWNPLEYHKPEEEDSDAFGDIVYRSFNRNGEPVIRVAGWYDYQEVIDDCKKCGDSEPMWLECCDSPMLHIKNVKPDSGKWCVIANVPSNGDLESFHIATFVTELHGSVPGFRINGDANNFIPLHENIWWMYRPAMPRSFYKACEPGQ
jgi:hypothetical protein